MEARFMAVILLASLLISYIAVGPDRFFDAIDFLRYRMLDRILWLIP